MQVYKDSLLQEGSLHDAGVLPGDDLVLLFAQEPPEPERLESTPVLVHCCIVRHAMQADLHGEAVRH